MTVAVRVIPCLDVADGRVVKGVNFLNLVDSGDPVELATKYYEQGADELTFLDVTATVENRSTMYELVERTAETLFIPRQWAAVCVPPRTWPNCWRTELTRSVSTLLRFLAPN